MSKSSGDSDGQKAENDTTDHTELAERQDDSSQDMDKLDVRILDIIDVCVCVCVFKGRK